MPFTPPEWTSGDRVRKLREGRGLAVRDLAEQAGVNKDTVTEVEKGNGASARTWAKLATALDAPVEWLRDGLRD